LSQKRATPGFHSIKFVLFYVYCRNSENFTMENVTSISLLETLLNATLTWTSENSSGIDDTLMIEPLSLARQAKHNVSPVLLSTEWPRLTRILFLTIMSVIGSVGNIFMISSVMIEDQLKKAGKHDVFLFQ
jgi:hypothetical protein